MDDVIVIGGTCPLCSFDKTFQRHNNEASEGFYRFDACPQCGFAYGTNDVDPPQYNEEVFKFVLQIWSTELRAGSLPQTVDGLLTLAMERPEAQLDRTIPTVFRYSARDPDLLESVKRSANKFFAQWNPKTQLLLTPSPTHETVNLKYSKCSQTL